VFRPLRFAAATAVSLLLGCADPALQQARARDDAAGWRSYLATQPESRETDEARDRLRELVYQEAIAAHSILGYKRFLEEFPNAPEAPAVTSRLAALRFLAAEEADTIAGWRGFLRAHPHASQSAEARRRLEALEGVQASAQPRALADGEILTPEADRALFASSRTSEALLTYLETQPAGRHRDDARRALLARELDGLLASDAPEAARALLEKSPLGEALEGYPERIAALEAELARFGPKDPVLHATRSSAGLRSIPVLTGELTTRDPLERAEAAVELGHHVSVLAIDPLLRALDASQHPLVRQAALEGLFRVLAALPPEVTEHEVSVRVARRRPEAASAGRNLILALLLDAGGRLDDATVDYQRAFDAELPDPVILRRWMRVRADRDEWYAAAVSARQLALWARRVAESHDAQSIEGVPPLAPSRRLCAAFQAAQEADALLQQAKGRAETFPEDVVAFTRVASDALALTRARLGDAELRLRQQSPEARLCGKAGMNDFLAQAAQKRQAAYTRALKERPALAEVLRARAARDPSPGIRNLAQAPTAAASPVP